MWGYQPHDQPGSSHLIRSPVTSVSKASRHHLVAEQGKRGWETWPLNFADEHLSCSEVSSTCRKSTTWDRRLYFPSEGRRATDFITLKIHRPRPGLNPRTLGPVASTLTTRPPRATHLSQYFSLIQGKQNFIKQNPTNSNCLTVHLGLELVSSLYNLFTPATIITYTNFNTCGMDRVIQFFVRLCL
jgi:hypothetical protein